MSKSDADSMEIVEQQYCFNQTEDEYEWVFETVETPSYTAPSKKESTFKRRENPHLTGLFTTIPEVLFANKMVLRREALNVYNPTSSIQRAYFFLDLEEAINLVKTTKETYGQSLYHEHLIGETAFVLDLEIKFGASEITSQMEFLDTVVYEFIVKTCIQIMNQILPVKIKEKDVLIFTNCKHKYSAHTIFKTVRLRSSVTLEAWTISIIRKLLLIASDEFKSKYNLEKITSDIRAFPSMRMAYNEKAGKENPLGHYDPASKTIDYTFNEEIFRQSILSFHNASKEEPVNVISIRKVQKSSSSGDIYDENANWGIISEPSYKKVISSPVFDEERLAVQNGKKSAQKISMLKSKEGAVELTDRKTLSYKAAIQNYYKTLYRPDFQFNWETLRIKPGPSSIFGVDLITVEEQLPCCYIYRLTKDFHQYEVEQGVTFPVQIRDHDNLKRNSISFIFNLKTMKMHQICLNDECKRCWKDNGLHYELDFVLL